MYKIAVNIITFNRIDLFKKVINGIRTQTRKPDAIIVVNNNSTDGTTEWLAQQTDITLINQENTGSSGGQYTGIKKAYDMGYDWIWTMDDDVIPEPDCLEELVKNLNQHHIIAPLRRNTKNEVYFNDILQINLSKPLKSIWTEVLNKRIDLSGNILAEGLTFEGPLFHRSLIDKIGLPEKKFFIYGDDTEFFIRSSKAGFKQYIIPKAKLIRQIDPPAELKAFNWKTYYELRNIIAIDVLHGTMPVRLIRPFAYYFDRLKRCKNLSEVKTITKSLINGYFYKSEN